MRKYFTSRLKHFYSKSNDFSFFKSPHRYAAIAFLSSFVLKIPRFFHFELNYNGTDYQTTKMYEDKQYITFSSYWDDIVVTGLLPILILAWLNLKIYLKVRKMHNKKPVLLGLRCKILIS